MRQLRGRGILLSIFLLTALAGSLEAGDPRTEGAWLGVSLDRSSADGGARIARVFRDSPAEAAGLRARDRVLALDGVPISSAADLVQRVAQRGTTGFVALTVSRGGHELLLDARLAPRPEVIDPRAVLEGWIGLSAIDLPPTLREHFGAPAEAGVMVADVVGGSPAEAAGFEPGDVVYEVDGERLASTAQLVAGVRGMGVGNSSTFAVVRDGSDMVLEARVAVAPAEPDDPRR